MKSEQELIGEYAGLYDAIAKRMKDNDATRAVLHEVGKHRRMRELAKGRVSSLENGDVPASAKQMGDLKQLGVDMPEKMSKTQASGMIDDALNR